MELIKKRVFIISNIEGVNFLKRNIVHQENFTDDLISYISIEKYIKHFENKFENIYDLSNYTIKEIKDFYINKVFDLTYTQKDEKKYDYIYKFDGYLQLCSMPIKHYELDNYWDNISYGHSNAIKNYCSYNKTINLIMEHGCFLADQNINIYAESKIYPGIITPSDYSYNRLIKQTQKHIIRIGPYIHYADNLYTDYFLNHIKQLFGKTLLVFPAHSHSNFSCEFDVNNFIEYIDDLCVNKKIETVLICMYSTDIQLGRNKFYSKENFNIVSCGNSGGETRLYDFEYINKVKTLINLSDFVISNLIGSYIGYSIYLNKPVSIFDQDIYLNYNNNQYSPFSTLIRELTELFISTNFDITKEQYIKCSYIWGFDCIKTKEEIVFILDFYNEIFNICKDKINEGQSDIEMSKIYNSAIEEKLQNINNKYLYLLTQNRP